MPSISPISDDFSESPNSIDRESDSPVLVDQLIPHGVVERRSALSVDWDVVPSMRGPVLSPAGRTEGSRLLRGASGVARGPEYETPDSACGRPGVLMSPASTVPTRSPPDTKHPSQALLPAPSSFIQSSRQEKGVSAVVAPSPSPEIAPSLLHILHHASSMSGSPKMQTTPPRMGNSGPTIQVPQRSHFSTFSDSSSRSSSRSEIVPPRSGAF